MRRVHLPLAKARWATAAVLVGVDALKELPIVLLLRPFGFDTLPVWVYNLASESRFQQAALPALSIVFVALIPVYPALPTARPRHDQRTRRQARSASSSAMSPPSMTCRSNSATDELLALVGPSGCGKSTLLRRWAGLHRPDTVDPASPASPSTTKTCLPPERRRVGLVFQEHALFPHLSVAKNIAFGVGKGATADARVAEMLEVVGLDDFGDRYPHELSGGERQRVALARALAPEPALMLLDEPFASLDPNLRARVRSDVVSILRSTGTPAVFVTHDQAEALAIGDRIAVMRSGRVVQLDRPWRSSTPPSTVSSRRSWARPTSSPRRPPGPTSVRTR